MNQFKRKRFLAFEQLDSRIALNVDMHSMEVADYSRSPERYSTHGGSKGNLEIRTGQFATGNKEPSPSHRLSFPTAPMYRFEHGSEKIFLAMRSRPEGEPPPPKPPVLPIQVETPTFSFTVVRPNSLKFEPLIQSEIAVSGNPIPVLSVRLNPVYSNQILLNLDVSNNTEPPRLEAVNASSSFSSGPAPSINTPISSSQSNANLLTILPQEKINSASQQVEHNAIVSRVSMLKSVNHALSTQKRETVEPLQSGMLMFSLHSAKEKRDTNGRDGNRILTNYDQQLRNVDRALLSENERLFESQIGISRKLPVPKGMIEVRDLAETVRAKQPTIVSRASNSPFEILQLMFGSSNMRQGSSNQTVQESAFNESSSFRLGSKESGPNASGLNASGLNASGSSESGFSELAEFVSREDSMLALAVGALFALAFRKYRKSGWLVRAETRHAV